MIVFSQAQRLSPLSRGEEARGPPARVHLYSPPPQPKTKREKNLRHGQPTINRDALPRDGVGGVSGEVHARLGKVVDRRRPPQRCCVGDEAEHLRSRKVASVGALKEAAGDKIYANALGAELGREVASDADESGLRGGVVVIGHDEIVHEVSADVHDLAVDCSSMEGQHGLPQRIEEPSKNFVRRLILLASMQ